MNKMLLGKNTGISKSHKPDFIFRGLNNPGIFYDEVHRRMMNNYYNAYLNLSISYLNRGRTEKAVATLDTLLKKIPLEIIQPPIASLFEIGNIYFKAQAFEKYRYVAGVSEELARKQLEKNPSDIKSFYNPYRILISIYERNKDYKNLAMIWNKILVLYPNDPNVRASVERYKRYAVNTDSMRLK